MIIIFLLLFFFFVLLSQRIFFPFSFLFFLKNDDRSKIENPSERKRASDLDLFFSVLRNLVVSFSLILFYFVRVITLYVCYVTNKQKKIPFAVLLLLLLLLFFVCFVLVTILLIRQRNQNNEYESNVMKSETSFFCFFIKEISLGFLFLLFLFFLFTRLMTSASSRHSDV